MAAEPPPGRGYFTAPAHPNQRRYEALRAYFTEDLTVAEAGARAGYTRSSMASLLRNFRAGRLELFAPPGKPGPKTAPAKDRARARVTELRREGLSVYEISARLRAEGTPLNRTGVGQTLAEEGFGRLLRGPAPAASTSPATAGRDTQLPRAAVIDFAAVPARAETRLAGLLLRPPGEVHRPHMRQVQGTVSPFGPEPDHEGVPHHPAEHVPAEHERQAAEHLPLGHRLSGWKDRPDPVSQVLVVSHAILQQSEPARPACRQRRPDSGKVTGQPPGDLASHALMAGQYHDA